MNKFEVIVSNIGTVYSGHSLVKAKRSFAEYVAQSKTMRGRAGGESVTLMDNDEPINEHYGEDDLNENPRANYAADYFDRDKTMSASEWAQSMVELRAGKPRPIAKRYGRNGPTELQAMNHAAEMRAWNARYRYASAMQKSALERENALFFSGMKRNPRHAGTKSIKRNPRSLTGARARKAAKKIFVVQVQRYTPGTWYPVAIFDTKTAAIARGKQIHANVRKGVAKFTAIRVIDQ